MSYSQKTSNRRNGGRPLYVKILPVWKAMVVCGREKYEVVLLRWYR